MFDYKVDLSTYYPSNGNKFNIYLDSKDNMVGKNVSLPYILSISNWKSSYTLYLENLSIGCGDLTELVISGQITTTTTINFILTTTQYIPPTTLFTTTTTTTTTSTTITTVTTQYVPPTTKYVAPTTSPPPPPPPPPPPTTIPPAGYKVWYSNAKSITLQRDNCSPCIGTFMTYNVEWAKHSVTRLEGVDGQQDADNLAEADISTNGQNYANTYGSCYNCPSTVFNNTRQTITKTRNDCGECTGTSVVYVIAAGRYQSNVDQNDANNIAIGANQENAQINANLNGLCINCPPPPTTKVNYATLRIGVSSDCIFGNSNVYLSGLDGNPYSGGNYAFNIDGEDWVFGTFYNKAGLTDGIHTGYLRDANETIVSQKFNVTCVQPPPPSTAPPTTPPPPPPCDCHRGEIGTNGQFLFTDCFGMGTSGFSGGAEGGTEICFDISKSHMNIIDLGSHEICNCG